MVHLMFIAYDLHPTYFLRVFEAVYNTKTYKEPPKIKPKRGFLSHLENGEEECCRSLES